MSARDLAIGLLLGDGGGGGYYDRTFHEILDHTEIFFEKVLDSTYTVKFGMWTQQGFVGNLEAYTSQSDVDEYFGYNNTEDSTKFCGLLAYDRYTITPVYIIYKNNAPIYAMPGSQDIGEKFTPEFNVVEYSYSGNTDDSIKYAFYVYRDYRIESISCLGGSLTISTKPIRFDDTYYNLPSRYFTAYGGFSIVYSYQYYNAMGDHTEQPYVVPSGNRVTRTHNFTLYDNGSDSITGQNYRCQNTVFTDLSNEELYQEFQNVYNAEFTALGFETYPVEILSPSS